jgi:TonB family protein
VNEAVDRVIEQREAMDRGLPAGFVLSGLVHLLVIGGAVGASWLGASEPPLKVAPIFAVPLPPGGGGERGGGPAAATPPVTTPPAPEPPAPAPEPPPKVIKPPKEEPKGLPKPEARRLKIKDEARPAPRRPATEPRDVHAPRVTAGTSGGTGTNSTMPGLGIIAPPGPGAPGGTDANGDWYLAGVQRKIWLIWTGQMKTGFAQPITVSFTILADGTLDSDSVRVLQSSGTFLLDNAARRAIFSAAPFAPLPRTYGTNRITIQALFQPTP